MKEFDIADYLEYFCNKLETEHSDIVKTCEVYGGQIGEDASSYLNFNVNTKSQCFISYLDTPFERGINLLGNASFAVFVVTVTDRKTKGFSTIGIKNTQKIAGFINNSEQFDGVINRPEIENISLVNNIAKDKTLYNVFMISFNQRVNLKQYKY